jgi:hypothetical protein
MSAFGGKADIIAKTKNVRFVPATVMQYVGPVTFLDR